MLSPDDRQTLFDALRPPAGSRLGCAVGTTYSLNLDAALTAPAAFALYAVTDLREAGTVEPLELLDSIRRHAGRFTVFFQAGQAAVPARRRLFAYLEGAVIPVAAPNGGVFHPKLWVLRFDSDDNAPTYRMLCASRNLTHDHSWDTMLRLDSIEIDDDAATTIDPSGLAHIVRALPGLAVGHVDEQRAADIAALADQLETVRWSPPVGVHSGRFVPIGLAGPSSPPFPSAPDRLAVVSPFLTAGLLKQLPASPGRRVLVSRPDQIANCAATIGTQFSEVYTLDPDAIPSGTSDEGVGEEGSDIAAEDPTVPFEGLHAKLFVFDHGPNTTVLTGSANATTAAFGKNVEFLTELTGARKVLGVDALLAEPAKDVQTLRSFLIPFPLEAASDYEDAGDPAEDLLDVLRREVAVLPFEAYAVADGSDDRFQLRFASTAPIPPLPEGVTWRCWPITLAADSSHDIDLQAGFDETFKVSFEGITAFFANELTLNDVSTQFVITAELREAPTNRSTRLLRILLGDAERFLRYLLMLLADDAVDQFGLTDVLDALDSGGDGQWQTTPDSLPLLEALLRTLSRDPGRLDHIQHLITDLQADPEGESLLPTGLMEIWEPIWAVAQERRR